MFVKVDFKRLNDKIKLPEMAYNDKQAGIDFYTDKEVAIYPNRSVAIDLQVAWKPKFTGIFKKFLRKHFKLYLQLKSKSGLAFSKSIEVTNAGVIDEDYEDSIKVIIYNNKTEKVIFPANTKICQGIVHMLPRYEVAEVTEFEKVEHKSHRGIRGFGSSDK